jgi:hypothetical protein
MSVHDTIVNIVSATVDQLRRRNLGCSRSSQHDCCLPALLNGVPPNAILRPYQTQRPASCSRWAAVPRTTNYLEQACTGSTDNRAELLNYRADFTKPLQLLCERLQWNLDLLRQIATEWQARNSSDASLFEFDSTVGVTESLWQAERRRRDDWGQFMDRDHRVAFVKFLQDLGECLRIEDGGGKKALGGKEDVSVTASFLQSKARTVTVQVKSVST